MREEELERAAKEALRRNSITKYLTELDPKDLAQRIRKYLSANREGWSQARIGNEINRVLMQPGTNYHIHEPLSQTLPAGTTLYRARVIGSTAEIKTSNDVMHRTDGGNSEGRFNKQGEALLYTAFHPTTALFEVGVIPGELVAVAEFQPSADLQCTYVGSLPPSASQPIRQRQNRLLIGQFLADIISQRHKPHDEANYKETEKLIKDLYDLPPEQQRGWIYKSFADPSGNGLNASFRPDQAYLYVHLKIVRIIEITSQQNDAFGFNTVSTLRVGRNGALIDTKPAPLEYPLETVQPTSA